MKNDFYKLIAAKSLGRKELTKKECYQILKAPEADLFLLLDAVYRVRRHYYRNDVLIHILNNVQNGYCPEDCHYCAQSKKSKAPIAAYAMKSEKEILAEAGQAYRKGAFRYCMVFSGKGPAQNRIKKLCGIIKKIKSKYSIEVCVSPGVINEGQAQILKKAGLNRLNHNINTSKRFYPKICTTHSYHERLTTIQGAKRVGLKVCSGVIIGMGETNDDIIEMALTLRKNKADSIPINFFIPIPGLPLKKKPSLSPRDCLKILCLFRLVNPSADIRIAAGREAYLKQMEPLSLYAANSLFLEGYLNVKGDRAQRTIDMIHDAGFHIKSNYFKSFYKTKTSTIRYKKNSYSFLLKKRRDLRVRS